MTHRVRGATGEWFRAGSVLAVSGAMVFSLVTPSFADEGAGADAPVVDAPLTSEEIAPTIAVAPMALEAEPTPATEPAPPEEPAPPVEPPADETTTADSPPPGDEPAGTGDADPAGETEGGTPEVGDGSEGAGGAALKGETQSESTSKTRAADATTEAPALRWQVKDPDGLPVADTTFIIEGPRSGDPKADEVWQGTIIAKVTDNTGQDGYVGEDLDPAPGVFEVAKLVLFDDPTKTHEIALGEIFRTRMVDAEVEDSDDPKADPTQFEWRLIEAKHEADPEDDITQAPKVEKAEALDDMIITPFAASGQATITISAAVIRGSAANLAGVTYRLHNLLGSGTNADPYRPGNASAFACTIAPAANSCVITVTGVNNQGGNNKSWFIVQSANGLTYNVDQYRLGDFSTPTGVFYYVGRTAELQSTRDYVVPGAGSGSGSSQTYTGLLDRSNNYTRASTLAVPQRNALIAQTCTPGLKIAIQMDISSSTEDYRVGYRNSLHSLIDSLVGTGTLISLFTFGNTSPVGSWENTSLRNVDTQATAIKNSITTYTGNPGTQRTNWDAAFRRIATVNATNDYDLVLFITDGAPNVVWANNSDGYTSPNGNNVAVRSIDEAIISANALKNAGVRIATVGVGNGVAGEVRRNLQAISGLTANSDFYVGAWGELETYLKNIIDAANCSLPVTVSKTTVPNVGQPSENVAGWQFSAELTADSDANVTLEGTTAQTSAAGFNGRPKWNLDFTLPSNQTGGVTLTETSVNSGYTFTGVACTVDGTAVQAEVDLVARSATIRGLNAGSGAVHCAFTNTQLPPVGALSIVKAFDASVPDGSGITAPFAGHYTCTLDDDDVATGTWAITGTGSALLTPDTGSPDADEIPIGAECSATETAPSGSQGLPDGSWEWDANPAVSAPVTIAAQVSTITVTNKTTRVFGTVTWQKVDDSVPAAYLADSEWRLTGPAAFNGGNPLDITDCIEATPEECTGPDLDNRAGYFEVEQLPWGDYELEETRAPAGHYPIEEPLEFTVAAATLNIQLGQLVNERMIGPPIPLTGGLGRDFYLTAGALILLIGIAGATGILRRRARKEVA